MLPKICPKLACRKRLVKIVQGLTEKSIGIKPKDTTIRGSAAPMMNNITFSPMINHTGFNITRLRC